MDPLQFYPITPALAAKAVAKFRNRRFDCVIDPSAGTGDFLKAVPRSSSARQTRLAIEIDVQKHAALREKGITVIGYDFFDCACLAQASHIVLNPPFRNGAEHVLRAWELLYHGEIVAVINAQTLRNANSMARQRLLRLIEQHSAEVPVEYVTDAFMDPQAERKTPVEVAIVYLHKIAQEDEIGSLPQQLVRGLQAAKVEEIDPTPGKDELVIPQAWVENAVCHFDAARAARVQATLALSRAGQATSRLGDFIAPDALQTRQEPWGTSWIRETIAAELGALRKRAWASLLRHTEVQNKISSQAYERLKKDFAQISEMEFSATNIRAFVLGLANAAGDIQTSMMCDVFDLFTRYHENAAFYRGWKSNTKHNTAGRRIKCSRIIIPANATDGYAQSLDWESMRMLADIDKVFAILAGNATPKVGLHDAFTKQFKRSLSNEKALFYGHRVQTDYFDVRYYAGVGSIHLYPQRKDLIDRLNRWVGGHRQWLPPNPGDASEAFWKHYDLAEKMSAKVDKALKARMAATRLRAISLNALCYGSDDAKVAVNDMIATVVEEVALQHGIDLASAITHDDGHAPKLLMAA